MRPAAQDTASFYLNEPQFTENSMYLAMNSSMTVDWIPTVRCPSFQESDQSDKQIRRRVTFQSFVKGENKWGTGHFHALAGFLQAAFLFLALLLCHISYRQVLL